MDCAEYLEQESQSKWLKGITGKNGGRLVKGFVAGGLSLLKSESSIAGKSS